MSNDTAGRCLDKEAADQQNLGRHIFIGGPVRKSLQMINEPPGLFPSSAFSAGSLS